MPAAHAAPPAFHLLAKPTGAVCNLDCSYCFFLSKEMLYPGSRFRMADELLEAYVSQLIEAHATVPEVAIAWQGGEPTLMGVEFFRRSVELADVLLEQFVGHPEARARIEHLLREEEAVRAIEIAHGSRRLRQEMKRARRAGCARSAGFCLGLRHGVYALARTASGSLDAGTSRSTGTPL